MAITVNRTAGGLRVELESEEDTERFGQAIAEFIEPGTVVGLVGPLGAGKTKLVRAIAERLGVDPGAISSPTFVLIQEYDGRLPVYHFDAYRLDSTKAFEELGVAEYWDGGGVSLIEWADRVRAVLPVRSWTISLEPSGPASRSVRIELPADQVDLLERLAERLTSP
jgi:tRNA threonylcarbamoyladenosine biosynthesis protein TsaE